MNLLLKPSGHTNNIDNCRTGHKVYEIVFNSSITICGHIIDGNWQLRHNLYS